LFQLYLIGQEFLPAAKYNLSLIIILISKRSLKKHSGVCHQTYFLHQWDLPMTSAFRFLAKQNLLVVFEIGRIIAKP
jgi:hypothetical protein